MKKLDVPKIEPINVKQYEFKAHTHRQANYHSEASLYRHHRAERVY